MGEAPSHPLLTLADRVRYAIELRQVSQADVANRAGCAPQLISQLVTGATKTTSRLPDIAKALGIRHDWLYYGQGAMTEEEELPFDEETFLNCIEVTLETTSTVDENLSPMEIARLCLELYEASCSQKEKYDRLQIEAVAPVLIKHYKSQKEEKRK